MKLRAVHILAPFALLALVGCDSAQEVVDDAARVTAKATVQKVLTAHLPQGVPANLVTPYSDCIIDGASAGEIFRLSRASVSGVDADTIGLVTTIIRRPQTSACIGKAALDPGAG